MPSVLVALLLGILLITSCAFYFVIRFIPDRNEIGKLWLAWDDNINQIFDQFPHCYMMVLPSVGKFPFFISSVEADVSFIHLLDSFQ